MRRLKTKPPYTTVIKDLRSDVASGRSKERCYGRLIKHFNEKHDQQQFEQMLYASNDAPDFMRRAIEYIQYISPYQKGWKS